MYGMSFNNYGNNVPPNYGNFNNNPEPIKKERLRLQMSTEER